MPTPTLSERLLAWAEYHRHYEPDGEEGTVRDRALTQKEADLREAARLLAPYKQPEVAELLRRAAEYEGGCAEVVENAEARATDLCRWAAALVALAEARARLAEAEGLPMSWRARRARGASLWLEDCARELEAALAGAGETDAEVSSRRTGAVERELGNVVSHMGGEFSLDSLKSALSGAGGESEGVG